MRQFGHFTAGTDNRFNILEQSYTSQESNLTRLQKENNLLMEQVQHLKAKLYNRKSEKSACNQDQLNILNEAEEISAEENKAAEIQYPHTPVKRVAGGRCLRIYLVRK